MRQNRIIIAVFLYLLIRILYMTIPFTKDNIVFWYNTLSIAQEGIVFFLALFIFQKSWDSLTKMGLFVLMAYNISLIGLYSFHYADTFDEYTEFCKDNKTAMIVCLVMIGLSIIAWLFGVKKWCDEQD
jgi:hypothetical protein